MTLTPERLRALLDAETTATRKMSAEVERLEAEIAACLARERALAAALRALPFNDTFAAGRNAIKAPAAHEKAGRARKGAR